MSQTSYDFWPGDATATTRTFRHVYSDSDLTDVFDLATFYWEIDYTMMNDKKDYSVKVECISERITPWKFDVELDAKFNNGSESITVKAEKQFSSNRNVLKVEANFEKGSTKGSVDVLIKLKNIQGVRIYQRFDLLKEVPQLGDVSLVFDDKKLKVNRAYLSHFSPYFRNLFFGQFAEKNQHEVELKNVDFEEFADLMNVISPERKEINNENIKYILKLADYFDMQTVTARCEQFLATNNDDMDEDERLMLMDKYNLLNAKADLIRNTSANELEEIRESKFYSEMSDATKAALFERAIQLLKID